ncbi:MAG: hypothetical protein KatS3mg057_0028 [Herpetosiphonaceae bacterium]|nr:MAG: hypothetical protein KatS3mg057_0028 [Herpetosiphonaceae bacterium]
MSAMVILPHEGDVALGCFVVFKLAGQLTNGSERYFAKLHELLANPDPFDVGRIIELAQKYGLDLDFRRVDELAQKYGVRLPEPPQQGGA